MAEHELKTWPEPFAAIASGNKRHELRRADRPFAVGDTLRLREWAPGLSPLDFGTGYSGRVLVVEVTHLTPGGAWGLPADLCVMSIDVRASEGFGTDDSRCAVCAWPLAASIEEGCTRGNCSHRPRPERLYAPERAAKERL